MLKIMEAFSKAKEYCEVGLCVNASNLNTRYQHPQEDDIFGSLYPPSERYLNVVFVDGES